MGTSISFKRADGRDANGYLAKAVRNDGLPALADNGQVHFEPGAEDYGREVSALLPAAITRIEAAQGRPFAHPVTVGVYATGEAYAAANASGMAQAVGVAAFGRLALSPTLYTTQYWRLPGILTHRQLDPAGMGNPAMILLRGIFTVLLAMLCEPSMAFAEDGSTLYLERCAVCHGADAKGTGPLAQKSNPPTPDLTSATFKARLSDYPGVIVSSVILRPNGNLIPKTLRENGITLPAHTWTDKELRDLNEYMTHLILKN